MTYDNAIQFLYGLQLFGAKLGLENTRELAKLSGNPEERLRFIHVAGTNGKGSTCAMLESIYREAGLRVGLFTSPHLISFRERIQINRQLISETEVVGEVSAVQALLRRFAMDAHPTFFEVVTIMALRHFAAKGCDIVILETGLGGKLDATNIVTPLASVITNVQLDHEKWLGQSIQQIAVEKSGIIKPGVPVVTAATEPARAIIVSTAAANASPLHIVNEAVDVDLPLPGKHQQVNAALAVETVRVLQARIAVSQRAIEKGLATVSWPGRLQVVKRDSQTILLDGAHNPAGAKALRDAIKREFSDASKTLLLGIMRDKDCAAICNLLAPLAHRVIACRVSSERSADPENLARLCGAANPKANVTAEESLEGALRACETEGFVVITGSLHFIGHALQLLCPSDYPDERALNEWTGATSTN